MAESEGVHALVAAVLASPKYRHIHPGLVQRVAAQELAKGRRLKETLKAVKNKLHQVGGAYFDGELEYDGWLSDLQAAAASSDQLALKAVCKQVMARHASTRERLPILEEFYTAVFAELPPIHSLLDLACGLNPLALQWMPLTPDAAYYACDIYTDMVAFLNGFMKLMPVQAAVWACDVIAKPPNQKVDLALLLKTIPCLEQVDKHAGKRLLDTINADYLLVSYPLHSLGGKQKGMRAHYEASFRDLVAGRNWDIKRFEFETELAFLVSKQ
ncbi:MAG: 16S rRNA methyltransferase [Chloroflexi bacterium]|nr:16S rRNA methyltransferase [Chloroflexota bacterium]